MGHERVALASSHEASMEPEHPACAGKRKWGDEADERLHWLH